ncbi:MAG: peptidoglycan-binding protein [Thermodesulfobacteriota bacterium]
MLYLTGSSGEEVRKINVRLESLGYLDTVDDQYDEATDQAVRYFQEDSGLKVDGKVGPLTWAALFPTTATPQIATPEPTGIPLQSQLLSIMGKPNYQEWRRKWITFISLDEFKAELARVKEFHTSLGFGFSGNRLLVNPLYAVLRDLQAKGLLKEITSFGGCFNIRPMRGRSIPSVHSYGMALDLNAPQNPLGKNKYSWSKEFAQTWADHGWEWGFIWDKPVDAMHFQYAWTRDWREYEAGDFVPKGAPA